MGIFLLIQNLRVGNIFDLNVNILQLEDLKRACEDPEHYGNLVVRISGYAIRVAELTDEQRAELLQRTLHGSM
jgi:formate C-acetyltransferase